MKRKHKIDEVDEVLPEYDFSKGVRGKYAERYAKGTKVIVTTHKRSTESYTVAKHSTGVTGRAANSSGSSKSRISNRAVKSVAGSALTQRPDRKKRKK